MGLHQVLCLTQLQSEMISSNKTEKKTDWDAATRAVKLKCYLCAEFVQQESNCDLTFHVPVVLLYASDLHELEINMSH